MHSLLDQLSKSQSAIDCQKHVYSQAIKDKHNELLGYQQRVADFIKQEYRHRDEVRTKIMKQVHQQVLVIQEQISEEEQVGEQTHLLLQTYLD